MPRLPSATLKSVNSAPLGPGVLLANVVDFTPLGIADILSGDESKGIRLGAMTTAPSFSITRETQDITENLVGLNAPLKGAVQIQRTDVTVDVELAELTHRNLKYIHPGLTEAVWNNAKPGSVTFGTGNAAMRATSRVTGVAANSISVAVSAPAATPATLISYSTGVFTLNPATGDTANSFLDKVQNRSGAIAPEYYDATSGIQLGVPASSTGAGTLATVASTSLAGGAASTAELGKKFSPTGYVPFTSYFDNLAMVLEGVNTQVLQIWRLDNAVQNDDISIEPDDSGAISGISCSFAGHVSDANFDASVGTYIPPYAVYNLNTPTSL
jgi:hypothetical protein